MEHSLAIAGLFKNNGPKETKRIYLLMKRAASRFREHHIVLLENDSIDGTAETLLEICDSDPHTTCVNLRMKEKMQQFVPRFDNETGAFSQKRFSRMSFLRNVVLEHVKKLDDIQYFVFVDSDLFGRAWLPSYREILFGYIWGGLGLHPGWWGGNSQAWNPQSILRTIHRANDKQPDWSAVCFYGTFGTRLNHYDMLAFRLSRKTLIPELAKRYKSKWDFRDWNNHFSNPSSHEFILHMGMFTFNYAKMTQLIPVESCFGALTIYKMKHLGNCSYNESATVCEHVPLHECLLKNFPDSIYLDPQSRVYYDTYSASYDELD
eukprot:CAMPEP_0178903620 /NCGR_PEP_ID=MMETSP0786-20121207/5255_1 /TAXON_ID=186022 /ORGANISM="Thalassionema frauenfeldii, Strain CCMP 1798" /LENGTH=319 /DNA_ID=CAMNT_0020575005 /DNA_START=156 /DNA_END=1115 /DNA_ORIENTATION=+